MVIGSRLTIFHFKHLPQFICVIKTQCYTTIEDELHYIMYLLLGGGGGMEGGRW